MSVVPVPPAPPEQHEFPTRGRGGLWLRFLAAAFVVVVLTAGATATAGLLGVQSFVDDLREGKTIGGLADVITQAEAGEPQTILLIGSDHRADDASSNARSDTMMLMRLDSHSKSITVLSIPRDLKVDYMYPQGVMNTARKINETYTVGGEALTARVIRHLLHVPINHVINVDFKGFREAVDAIGCVYVDVDRRYYHVNTPGYEQYAEIDISAGYQRLCGAKALDYVRFRHLDSDFVRAARQQDFLRQAKSQYGVARFISDPHKITKRVGKFLSTDKSLQSKEELLRLANLAAYSAGSPIREVHFPPAYDNTPGASYVTASPGAIAQVRREFLANVPPPTASADKPKRGRHGKKGQGSATAGDVVNMAETGESYAIQLGGGVKFPVYYPKLLTPNGQYATLLAGENPRLYRVRDKDRKPHAAYRLVVEYRDGANPGNYYGIQGTTWLDPPILNNPSDDTRTVNGKKLELFYDGKRLRTVAWRTPRAVYWVQNTLQEKLTNHQMLAIAGSLTRLGR